MLVQQNCIFLLSGCCDFEAAGTTDDLFGGRQDHINFTLECFLWEPLEMKVNL